ncbi:hypothetical protein BCR44DRAFT_38399 [Catenaria anguillulae PL171]|uniref:Uncharacterized protein n=1 Tax=Catenaria anguillulae PL171 TaxID=765915 RepID=A0A1Y2HRM4_9FUNG|nr:hypothetical protein BCR44DRAFT_38399 [Catenaria anguillulae PL171]
MLWTSTRAVVALLLLSSLIETNGSDRGQLPSSVPALFTPRAYQAVVSRATSQAAPDQVILGQMNGPISWCTSIIPHVIPPPMKAAAHQSNHNASMSPQLQPFDSGMTLTSSTLSPLNGVTSNPTLLEVRDPRAVVVTGVSVVLAIVIFGVSLHVYWRRRTWFYACVAVAIVPLLIAHVATFLAGSRLIHTNTFLIIRMLCPILTTSQVCSLSLYRYYTLASTGQLPSWFTRRAFFVLLCTIYAEMSTSILLLCISFADQDDQPYFTRHPWRWATLLVHMAVTCTLDFVIAVLTFRAVWLIRAGVLLATNQANGETGAASGPVQSSVDGSVMSTVIALVARSAAHPPNRSPSMADLHDSFSTSTSTTSHGAVAALPSPHLTRRVSKSASDSIGFGTDVSPLSVPSRSASLWIPESQSQAEADHPFPSSSSECCSHAPSNNKFPPPMERVVLGKPAKQPTPLRIVTLKLLVSLFCMMVALVSGLVLFTALDGQLFAATLSNLMIHIYLLPATLSWRLLAELTRATTI